MSSTNALTWIARADGWVAGQRVARGQRLMLTAAQAAYEPVDPAPAKPTPPKPVRRAARGKSEGRA